MTTETEPNLRIEMWIDLVCPWSYIAKRRLESAMTQFDSTDQVDLMWRSFELNRDAPLEPTSNAIDVLVDYGEDRQEVASRFEQIKEFGHIEGLELNIDTARPVRSFDAHRLTHLAADYDLRDQMIERLLYSYHTKNLNIADLEILKNLAQEVGLPQNAVQTTLAGDTYTDEVIADEIRAEDLGVTGVPTFAVNGVPTRYGSPQTDDLLCMLEESRITAEPNFVSILEYSVDGPEQQRQLADSLAEVVKEWVRFHPGFLSSRFHLSTDGTRVFNIIQWASEEAYRNFAEASDLKGRIAAIEDAFNSVSGSVSSPLDDDPHAEIPRYMIYRTVLPARTT